MMVVQLQIEMTESELKQLERLADEHGFASAEAYLKYLALEPTRAELLENIREGLLTVKRGDSMPTLDDLWTALDDADDEPSTTR